jgi:hypothetical protein
VQSFLDPLCGLGVTVRGRQRRRQVEQNVSLVDEGIGRLDDPECFVHDLLAGFDEAFCDK